MGFYDSYDFSKFKFLSRIKSSPSIATPCHDFLNAIAEKKRLFLQVNSCLKKIHITFLISRIVFLHCLTI